MSYPKSFPSDNPKPHKSRDEICNLIPLIPKLAKDHLSTPHWIEASNKLGPHARQAVERLVRTNAENLAMTISSDFHIKSEEQNAPHTYDNTDVAIRAVAAQAVLNRFEYHLYEGLGIPSLQSSENDLPSENDLLAALVNAYKADEDQGSGHEIVALITQEAIARLNRPDTNEWEIKERIQKHLELFRVLAEEALQFQSNEE